MRATFDIALNLCALGGSWRASLASLAFGSTGSQTSGVGFWVAERLT
jgi:hypothetical protein